MRVAKNKNRSVDMKLPFVSVCTPTFNRRPFVEMYDEKMTLGKKRNIMHKKACGDIIVYMDDDDYYPPDRVSHAVERLMENPAALCAGSSEMYIYFKDNKDNSKMVQFGPYGPNHATAGTFAFKRKLLKETQYNEEACLAEEREFLKNYTVPFVQLDPLKTILVFSHSHNTFDKRKLLENMTGNPYIKYETGRVETNKGVGSNEKRNGEKNDGREAKKF